MDVLEEDLHDPAQVVTAGTRLGKARGAAILMHGRGASARDMIALATHMAPPGIAVLAPQATGNSWYPYPFTAPLANNEPKLSSALEVIATIVAALGDAGLQPDRIAIGGFSQGACVATEFVARNAQRYGGVIGLSGGLIGPPGAPRNDHGDLEGTPVFLGCSDVDPHIPLDTGGGDGDGAGGSRRPGRQAHLPGDGPQREQRGGGLCAQPPGAARGGADRGVAGRDATRPRGSRLASLAPHHEGCCCAEFQSPSP